LAATSSRRAPYGHVRVAGRGRTRGTATRRGWTRGGGMHGELRGIGRPVPDGADDATESLRQGDLPGDPVGEPRRRTPGPPATVFPSLYVDYRSTQAASVPAAGMKRTARDPA